MHGSGGGSSRGSSRASAGGKSAVDHASATAAASGFGCWLPRRPARGPHARLHHISPQVSGSGFASGVKVAYDTALGAVGAVEYLFGAGTSKMSLGLRGTWFSLAVGGQSLDASGLGFLFAFYL